MLIFGLLAEPVGSVNQIIISNNPFTHLTLGGQFAPEYPVKPYS